MKFVTPEANKLFALAILAEKHVASVAKEYEKGNLADSEIIKYRKSLFEAIEKSESFFQLQTENYIGNKAKKGLKNA